MICPVCNNTEMKLIHGGVSKKTGKPYTAFYSCKCGYTENIEDEIVEKIVEKAVIKEAPKNGTDPYVEGKEKNTRLMQRTTLMCEVVKTFGTLGVLHKDMPEIFNFLWKEIEK